MKRKILLVALLVLATAIIASVLVACNPAEMEKIVGTYKLVTDKTTEYQQDTVDNIEKYGKEAYIVLTGNDYGYYVYKDNDMAAFARKVKLEYAVNDENKVTSITYVLGEGQKPNVLNVNAQKKVSLVYRWTAATKLTDARDIQYDRISDKTDLTSVKDALGEIPVFDYDVYQYHSMFCAELTNGLQKNYSDYIYKYYDVNTASCTATLYYSLKSNETPVVVQNLAVTFGKNAETNKPTSMTIGEDTFTFEIGTPHREVKVNVDGEVFDEYEELSWFSLDQTEYADCTAYFNSLIAEYKQSLQQA